MVCAFTGHRPQRLPWGGNEDDPRCGALKQLLREAVAEAVRRGCQTFLCGMARGCDTYFAEAVLALPERDLRLEAFIPCPEQADRWPEADRLRYRALLRRCAAVHVLEDAYSEGCMLRCNRAMVDRADLLITVYDGAGGGTASTIAYAGSRGVELLPLWM